jgi:hypothetical protein
MEPAVSREPKAPPADELSAGKRELVQRLLSGKVSPVQTRRLDGLGFAAALPTLTHDAAGRFEPFPLTEMQQAYWVGRQRSLELGNVAIHSYLEIRIETLDVERLERAWNGVIRRHDMLRAVIRPDGRQQVLREVDAYPIALETYATGAEHAAARRRLREHMSHEVFATDRWPLFSLLVTRGPEVGSVLHLSVDGVLLDAWSLTTVIRECLELYEQPERALPEPPVTFRDYVLAERRLREQPSYQASLEWWRRRLETLPGPPELPLATRPRLLRAPKFVRRSGELPAGAWQRLRNKAGAEGVTPPCIVLTLYAEVLSTWAGSRAFTLNVPRFDRLPLHPRIDDVVGEFASFTLMACDFSRPATVLERARQIQRQMWELLEHGQVSGLTVVRELLRTRGRGGAAFPVVFTANPSLGAHRPREAPKSLNSRVDDAITQTPQVWLDFQVGERDGALAFNWDAVDELFPSGVLDEMNSALCRRLARLAEDDVRLDEARSG